MLVDEVAESAADTGLGAVTKVCRGKPDAEILGYVDENDVDLVVIGYAGKSHRRTQNIGHVSERVVRR